MTEALTLLQNLSTSVARKAHRIELNVEKGMCQLLKCLCVCYSVVLCCGDRSPFTTIAPQLSVGAQRVDVVEAVVVERVDVAEVRLHQVSHLHQNRNLLLPSNIVNCCVLCGVQFL